MHLLDLPPEIARLVLRDCPTPDFLNAALSCRSLFNVALSARELVLQHLSQTPGLPRRKLTSSKDSTEKLFRLLRSRGAVQLYGVEHRADAVTHHLSDGRSIDLRASAIYPVSGHGNLAVVERRSGAVLLFDTRPGRVIEAVCELMPPFPYAGRFHARKVFFSADGRTLTVLQHYASKDPSEDDADASSGLPSLSSEPMAPFMRQTLEPFLVPGKPHLAHYYRRKPGLPFSHVAFASLDGPPDHEPIFIAAANPWFVAVCWQHVNPQHGQVVRIHHDDAAPDGLHMHDGGDFEIDHLTNFCTIFYWDAIKVSKTDPDAPFDTNRIIRLRFNDRNSQLLYYSPQSPLYGIFQRFRDRRNIGTGRSHTNDAQVHFGGGHFNSQPVDIPFYCTHEKCDGPDIAGPDFCKWLYLALTISRPTSPTDVPVGGLAVSCASPRMENCSHIINLDRGRRINEWTFVARLLDFDIGDSITSPPSSGSSYNTTYSVPPQTAYSRRGSYLAVASWKVIRVWPLNPAALINENESRFYPYNYGDPASHNDRNQSQGQAQGQDEDESQQEQEENDGRRNPVLIPPIVLHSDAVIFSLEFVSDNENELVCLTDRGVVTWDLGPLASGQRSATKELCDPPPLHIEPDQSWNNKTSGDREGMSE